jgi:hypothetical protein
MSDRCGSCSAPIEWATTAKGRHIPLDVETTGQPNVLIDDDGVAHVVSAGHGDRTPHWATCPDATEWRRH